MPETQSLSNGGKTFPLKIKNYPQNYEYPIKMKSTKTRGYFAKTIGIGAASEGGLPGGLN